MNITEALKTKHRNVRISCGSRWLVWDDTLNSWTVHSRKYAQKYTRTIVITEDEEEAVKHLLYEDD